MAWRIWLAGAGAFAALGLGALGFGADAGATQVGSNRAWVSGHGTDTPGCGAPTSPCRSLQYAHDNIVIAGGEIDVLDPAGYGAVTVTKAISIVNDGVGTAGVQTTGAAAITVNAGPTDVVHLRGLDVDGVGLAGTNGLVFNSGARLMVVNCVFRHFSNDGVLLQPDAGGPQITIVSSLAADNGAAGIGLTGVAGGQVGLVLDQVTADTNGTGIEVDSVSAGSSFLLILQDVRAEQNGGDGLALIGPAGFLNLLFETDMSYYSRNGGYGLDAVGGVLGYLSRSDISLNGSDGVRNATTSGGLHSFGDNHFTLDGVTGPALVAEARQ